MITEGERGRWSRLKVIQKIFRFSFPSAEDQTDPHACQASSPSPSYSPPPRHIREMHFPAPTVKHGIRDLFKVKIRGGVPLLLRLPSQPPSFPRGRGLVHLRGPSPGDTYLPHS